MAHRIPEILELLAPRLRLETLLELTPEPQTVAEIARVLHADTKRVRYHLNRLNEKGIIRSTLHGRTRTYVLATSVKVTTDRRSRSVSIEVPKEGTITLSVPLIR